MLARPPRQADVAMPRQTAGRAADAADAAADEPGDDMALKHALPLEVMAVTNSSPLLTVLVTVMLQP